jgi:6-phosphogluconolactonase
MQTTSRRQIHFVKDGENLSPSAAEAFVDAVETAIASRGVAAVALCGGTIARKLFDLLAGDPYADRLASLWPRIHVFFSTERHVTSNHPESAFRLVQWSLLSRFAIPSANVHRVRTTMADPATVARAYELEMRTFFRVRGLMRDGLPCFDLTVLALEAGQEAGAVESRGSKTGRWVGTRSARDCEPEEIVLTLPILGNARNSLVLFPEGDAAAAGCAAHLLRFVA